MDNSDNKQIEPPDSLFSPLKLRYNDALLRSIIGIPVAILLVVYNVKISNIQQGLTDPMFWEAIIGSYIITLLIFWAINRITWYLDKAGYDWKGKTLIRLALQFALGFLPIALLAFVLAALYFVLNDTNIFETTYLTADYPIILLFIAVANGYYFCYYAWYFANRASMLAKGMGSGLIAMPMISQQGETTIKSKQLFLAKTATKTIPIPFEQIAAFIKVEEYYQVRLFDRTTYIIQQTLGDVEKEIDTREFFRANRQYIVNYKACKEFNSYKRSGQLELNLGPPLNTSIIISRDTAPAFVKWMDR
jgi:hypothetical protein